MQNHSKQEQLLLDHTFTSSEDDPLLVANAEATKTYDRIYKKSIIDQVPRESARRNKKKFSKGRKHRGKQEIQATG